jgi:uncharacterized protein involved in exopolysaccharide biosynthesis
LTRRTRFRHLRLPLAGAILSSAVALAYLQTITTTYGAEARIRVDETLRPADSDQTLRLLPSSDASRSAKLPFVPNPDLALSVLAARTSKVIPDLTPAMVEDSVHVSDSTGAHEFEAFQDPVRTLEVNARATSAQQAATLANVYARAYVTYHKELFARQTTVVRAGLALREMVARRVPTTSSPQSTFQRWDREVEAVAELEAGRLRLYDRATAAEASRSPRPVRDVTVAALIGAFAGALLALLSPAAKVRWRRSV